MRKLSRTGFSLLLLSFIFLGSLNSSIFASEFDKVPVEGMVNMIDLGAKSCIPCKMMAPILEKIKKVYKNKAAIVFIDVREHREQIKRFGIRAIPTQIFYNENGEEVYRHIGFMSEKEIVEQLKRMGVH